jgi:hypothetical protein
LTPVIAYYACGRIVNDKRNPVGVKRTTYVGTFLGGLGCKSNFLGWELLGRHTVVVDAQSP